MRNKIFTLLISCFSLVFAPNLDDPLIADRVSRFIDGKDLLTMACTSKGVHEGARNTISEIKLEALREQQALVSYLADIYRENSADPFGYEPTDEARNRIADFRDKYFNFLGIKLKYSQKQIKGCHNTLPRTLSEQYVNQTVLWKTLDVGETKSVLTTNGERIAGLFYPCHRIGYSQLLSDRDQYTIGRTNHNLLLLYLLPSICNEINLARDDWVGRQGVSLMINYFFTDREEVDQNAAEPIAFLVDGYPIHPNAIARYYYSSTRLVKYLILSSPDIIASLATYSINRYLPSATWYQQLTAFGAFMLIRAPLKYFLLDQLSLKDGEAFERLSTSIHSASSYFRRYTSPLFSRAE